MFLTEVEEYSPNSAKSEESLTDITEKVFSYFRTHPGLVDTLGKMLDIDIIMSMLNVAVASLKSDKNSWVLVLYIHCCCINNVNNVCT